MINTLPVVVILTIIIGLFFFVGGFISLKIKDKDKLNNFCIAIAFVIILSLIFLDLGPEGFSLLRENYSFWKTVFIFIIAMLLGFYILRTLDLFIPTHYHEHFDDEQNIIEHNSHINHIGTLTLVSLIFHNILEGFLISGIATSDLKVGILACISVALHNIPLGTQVFSEINWKENKVLILILGASSVLGGLGFIFARNVVNSAILGVITSVTIGMLIFIVILELLPELVVLRKKKEIRIGFLIGMLLLIISLFI